MNHDICNHTVGIAKWNENNSWSHQPKMLIATIAAHFLVMFKVFHSQCRCNLADQCKNFHVTKQQINKD